MIDKVPRLEKKIKIVHNTPPLKEPLIIYFGIFPSSLPPMCV